MKVLKVIVGIGKIKRFKCLFIADEDAVEIQGATLISLLGIWLFFSSSFDLLPRYAVMDTIAPAYVWAAIFISIGLIQAYSILSDSKWSFTISDTVFNNDWIRKQILLVKGGLWLMLFVSVLFGEWRALAAPMYLTFSFNAFRAFFCINRKKESEKLEK